MNELTTTQPTNLDKIREKLRAKYNPLASDVCLLLDTSGSMIGTPIEKLRELADGFKNVRRIEFNSVVKELKPYEMVGQAMGGTAMHLAFQFMKSSRLRHGVLITDGGPDNPQTALRDAAGLKIDVIYVGTQEPAPPFLADLAAHTGGKYGSASLDELKKLMAGVRALIGAPKAAIQL